jgi:predicted TIM-barrel fold metal-dependent hydrolase
LGHTGRGRQTARASHSARRGARYRPVWEAFAALMSSGVPIATTCPPGPGPGPISITQSARLITSRWLDDRSIS